MRHRFLFRLMTPLIAAGLLMLVAMGQKAEPVRQSGSESIQGIPVIKNPVRPRDGMFAFDLREELVLGDDPEKEESYFPDFAQINVDETGNIFVSDGKNRRIQIFDKTGRLLRSLGRQGQGPGEYMYPDRVQFDSEGSAVLADGRGILIFGRDGTFRRKISLNAFFNPVIAGPAGIFLGESRPTGRGGNSSYGLHLLDAEGKVVKTMASFKGEFGTGDNVIVFHRYSSRVAAAPLTPRDFAYGFSTEYRIMVASWNGESQYIILKEEKPEPITAREKSENGEKGAFAWYGLDRRPKSNELVYPDHRPYFSRFMSDDVGHLYVLRFQSVFDQDAPMPVDVFSREGLYLYRMVWPRIPAVIRGGAFYEVRQDEETGETTVVRSRIRNWDKMKTS